MAKPAKDTIVYTVKETGWVAGKRVREGDLIELTERAARYETNIEPAPAEATEKKAAAKK